jgi:hypothetical protein
MSHSDVRRDDTLGALFTHLPDYSDQRVPTASSVQCPTAGLSILTSDCESRPNSTYSYMHAFTGTITSPEHMHEKRRTECCRCRVFSTNQEIPNEAPIRDVPSRIKPRVTFAPSSSVPPPPHNGQSVCSCRDPHRCSPPILIIAGQSRHQRVSVVIIS